MKNTISRVILLALAAASLAPTVAHAQPFSTNYWVTANYVAVLGRNPDPGGWVYWTGWVNANGGPTAQPLLTSAFLTSGEYCGFFGQPAGCTNPPDSAQFLTLLYQNALGRAPDQAGWTYYLGLLASGVTPAQVVAAFICLHGVHQPLRRILQHILPRIRHSSGIYRQRQRGGRSS